MSENAGGYCETCKDRTFGQCLKCYNCGFCSNGNSGKCIRGSMTGPKDTSVKCDNWYPNDIFWRNAHTLQKRVLTPFSNSK